MTLIINSPNVVSSQGVPISVTGVAQVKINGSSDEMLKAAAEQFGDKSTEEIMHSKYLGQAKIFGATWLSIPFRMVRNTSDSCF